MIADKFKNTKKLRPKTSNSLRSREFEAFQLIYSDREIDQLLCFSILTDSSFLAYIDLHPYHIFYMFLLTIICDFI